MTIELERGQAWKPTRMQEVIATREITLIADDENGTSIVHFRTLGHDPNRIHKLNVPDFCGWVLFFGAFQTEITQ